MSLFSAQQVAAVAWLACFKKYQRVQQQGGSIFIFLLKKYV
jgi:hypothetical protein